MAFRPSLPNLGPRTRKVLRIAGYVVLALVTFVFALQLTFPFDRVKAKIGETLAAKYVVTIGDVERGWIPGRVYFNSVSLQTRPSKSDDVASTIYIDRLEVDLGILPLLGAKVSVDLDAALGGGHIRGNISISKGATSVAITGSTLQSQMLPMREVIGLPMSGIVEFSFDLDLPNEVGKTGKSSPNWQKAEGSAELACPSGCTFGDGKTKLKTKLKNARNAAFAADGIEFGTVNIKTLLAKVEIKAGRLEVTKFDTKSDDGTLFIDYAMDLEPSLDESTVTGCLRFNGSQTLLKREPKTFTAISATGAPLGPDNLFHIRLADKFKDMKRLGQPCGSAVAGKSMDNPAGGGTSRPQLTVPPDEPVRTDASYPPPIVPDAGVDAAVTVPIPGPDSPGSAGHG
ncbi:MAG TPA: type II secretion system protein GspN, partial [Kofleriaceae bacterium]|nr:type II secretion system protein GspN [Kofleriaceae bacterium]